MSEQVATDKAKKGGTAAQVRNAMPVKMPKIGGPPSLNARDALVPWRRSRMSTAGARNAMSRLLELVRATGKAKHVEQPFTAYDSNCECRIVPSATQASCVSGDLMPSSIRTIGESRSRASEVPGVMTLLG